VRPTDIRHRLRALFRRRAVESELDEELRFHLDKAAEAYVREGLTPEEAMRRARIDLGGVEAVKENVRDARGVRIVYDLGADLRYGVRVLRKSPAFTLVAILTLALGIGANTAMFAVVDDVLMHPVPYDKPEELVRLHGSNASFERASISYPNFLDWQASNHSFSSIAASRGVAFTLTGIGTAERISGDAVSTDYFAVLGVTPLFGHTFATDEPVALLGERLWRRKFAAATDVVGRTIILDGRAYAVVGVMPERADLRGVSGGDPSDVYVPITQIDRETLRRRGAGLGIHGIARLAPGTTIEQAREDLAAVAAHLAVLYPETNRAVGAKIDPLEEAVVGNLRPYLLVLFAAVGLVLMIACVNVANLLLARSAVRSHELAIRVAVGASFGRLMRQLITESLLLACVGGAFGLLVSSWSTDALLALLPGRLSRVSVDSLDPRVLVFTVAISLVAGVLCGLVPAWKAIRPNLHGTIKEGGRGYSTRSRPQAVFIVLQTALAVVLLVGAGLLVRTMVQLSRTSPGYDPDGVVTFGLSLPPAMQNASPAAVRAALRDLDSAIATTPGVESAAFTYGDVPIEGSDQWTFWIDGRPKPVSADQMIIAVVSIVGPEYLTAMKIPLQRGRFLTARDDQNTPDVVVIDDVFANQHFPGEDPIGKRIRIGDDPVEIIGVVGHVKMFGLDQDEQTKVRAQMYFSFRQLADSEMSRASAGVTVIARTHGDRAAVVGALRATVERLGGDNVMFRVRTAGEIITGYQATRRFAMYVLGAFAALALLLCTIGIYGVVSYLVARRTTEIGIRMALGATASIVMRLILRDGLKLTLAGIAIGLMAACLVTRFMSGLLFGVSSLDPITFVVVAATVTLIALCALLVPARRATRLDVLQALRTE
jgi:putative ABC transport system permease protein